MWIANYGDGTVSKRRPKDDADLGTFAVGTNPFFLASDGENIWVANFESSNVSKLRACDGANLGTFATGGHFPEGLAFDEGFMWVANTGNNTVAKCDAQAQFLSSPLPLSPVAGLKRLEGS
jgi:DNA-binding beta-propeller fold protein YncE